GYPGRLNEQCVTMAEVLRDQGYGTYHSGKWHLTGSIDEPDGAWPRQRGFDHSYSLIIGSTSYWDPRNVFDDDEPVTELDEDFYLTTEIGERAAGFIDQHDRTRTDDPLSCCVAFSAPHSPLHARVDAISRYDGVYDAGWDELRKRRHHKQLDEGLLAQEWDVTERDHTVPAWEDADGREWQARRMAVYAAQVELMDAAVGRVVGALETTGRLDDTLLVFLSDNGGCAEEFAPRWADENPSRPVHTRTHSRTGERVRVGNVPELVPGGPTTHCSYGVAWANVSNTPFREYKHWVHEGGIATPLIAHWPTGLGAGGDHP